MHQWTRWALTGALMIAAGLPAQAGQYDLKEMTPQVQAALDGRRQRYDQLQEYKQQGWLGENNRGLVEALNDSSSAKRLAVEENADRMTIYRAIVDQHQLGEKGLDLVQQAFASVKRDKAKPGDYIQTAEGDWIQK